ncbi:hypothetical protein Q5M85_00460 [Paraclostridium bifermentans]|nr:hypothetical protein [Paraclostridium bifermentans]
MGDKVNVNFDVVDSKTGNYKETISKEFIIGGIIKIFTNIFSRWRHKLWSCHVNKSNE